MKQPKNEIKLEKWDNWYVCLYRYSTDIALSEGRTKLAALNFALRRAERLVRDIKKLIERESR